MPSQPRARRLTPWVALAALVLLGGGAATASALTAPAVPTSAAPPEAPSTTPTTAGPPAPSAAGPTTPTPTPTAASPSPYSPPPAGALTTRIELPSTTLVAGSTVKGDLVVSNQSGTYSPTDDHGCGAVWAVGLKSGTVLFSPAFTMECASPPVIGPGVSRLPFTLEVTYPSCSMDPQSATPNFPACINGDVMPPLPPGAYQAVLVSEPPVLSAPGVEVEVVAPPNHG